MPPKSSKPQNALLRLTLNQDRDGDGSMYVARLAPKHNLLLLVRETGSATEKPHLHGVLRTHVNVLRNVLRREFGLKGNQDYSVKKIKETEEDLRKTMRYCCKGESKESAPDVLFAAPGVDVKCLQTEYYQFRRSDQSKTSSTVLMDCYEGIRSVSTDPSSLGISIYRWYVDQKKRLPSSFNMSSMMITYAAWNNESAPKETKLSDADMFRRCYPNLG